MKCPGNLILQTYDLARALRDAGMIVVSGFHSPTEKDCLDLLLRGEQPVIACPARSIHSGRLPTGWRAALTTDRLLVLSPFGPDDRRATAALAQTRNVFVAALATSVFVAYAHPGSKTESFCRDVLASGKPLFTFDAPENAALSHGSAARSGLAGGLRSAGSREAPD